MIELTPKQTQVINVCIGKKVSVILGEVGSGKSVTSVSLASLQGYENVLLITEAGLPMFDQTEYPHKVANLIKLPYSQLLQEKNSVKSAFVSATKIIKTLPKIDFVIVDEAHNIKNKKSQRTKVALALLELLDCPLLLMSGSFRPTNNADLYLLLGIATQDRITYEQVMRAYDAYELQYTRKEPIPFVRNAFKSVDINNDKLQEIFFSVVQVLPKIKATKVKIFEYLHRVKSCPKTVALNKYIDKHKAKIIDTKTVITKTVNTKLYLADGIAPINDTMSGEIVEYKQLHVQPKLDALKKILAKEHKAIVMCRFKASVDLIEDKLKGEYNLITVDATTLNRAELVDTFRQSKGKCILLSTVSCMSTGHDLDCADCLVFYSVPANYKDIQQAYGRIDRMNSTRTKRYHWIVTNLDHDTVKAIYQKTYESIESWGFGFSFETAPIF